MVSGVSACIITFNEEDRLGDCLQTLQWCDEIIVVDSLSTDRTRDVAARLGARVIMRRWPGHVAQKEFAIRAAGHDWVLCLDADERLSPELQQEIINLRQAGFPGASGWDMPRLSTFLGRPMRHGTWYPDRKVRLFDRRHGHWGGINPHDHVILEEPPQHLTGDLLHHPYRSFAEHLRVMDGYASIGASELNRRGKKARLLDLVVRPLSRFVKFYVLRHGWLAGWRGLLLAYLTAYSCRLKYAKLMVMQRVETEQDYVPEEKKGSESLDRSTQRP